MDIKPVGNHAPQQGHRILDAGSVGSDAQSSGRATAAVETANAVKPSSAVPEMSKLEDAVKSINAAINALSPNLEFSVDSETDRTVVKVVDKQTNEVIRQLPTPEALEIAKAVDRLQGLLIRQKA